MFSSLILLCQGCALRAQPTALPKRPMDASTIQRADSLYAIRGNNLIDLTRDRERIMEILERHRSPEDLKAHLDAPGEFVMHYLVFPLRVAVVIQADKPKYVSPEAIQHGVDILNSGMVDTWVQFKVVQIDTIVSPLTVKTLREDAYEAYYTFSEQNDFKDTTSLYLFDNEEKLCEDFACSRTSGFANILETYTNNVVLDKFFLNDRKVIVHEFGHYFGLYHTAETRFGIERVDGSNCAEAGDKVCDTPADPGELFSVYVNYTGCRMAGFKEEGSALEYAPMINNYMSYYFPCYMKGFAFTPGQLEVIFRAAIWFRQNQIIELGEVPLAPWP